ncbi:MAG: RluA family pseudouridine synthase, partial [Bifidobacteriaceae bacterium]|nr:RluA family pseudouridine synthase [Bifidobacteriaceae bacterium]
MTERQICTVSEDLAGQRVDVGLANWLGISRAQAAQLASTGLVELSGKKVGKADRLTAGLQLSAQLPPAEQPAALLGPAALHPLTLLYRDDHLVIVNKPAGLAVHASVGWQGPTVLATLAQQGIALAPSEQLERPGVVHRLDAGTTGVLVVACSTEALNGLKQAFQERTVTKTYHALVQGRLDPPIGIIDAPIGRHPGAAFKFAVRENGKAARTHYRVL